MILLTGAAGFIASNLIKPLMQQCNNQLIISDDFSRSDKRFNFKDKTVYKCIDRNQLIAWLNEHNIALDWCIHIGARTDTTEYNTAVFNTLNVEYTKALWKYCTTHKIPFIYASSAATYGDGQNGYSDSHSLVNSLKPLNPYGDSKHRFDLWALNQQHTPPHWYGLKFFNVYGPNEYHKGRMASVVYHAFRQIQDTGTVKLFKSHRSNCDDGMQKRDFIYVKDLVKVILYLIQSRPSSGLYNLGTGNARSFNDLVAAVFNAMRVSPNIKYIDIPQDIREAYQYFTEAQMQKLLDSGYTTPFYSLESGIHEYVNAYLMPNTYE